MSPLLLECDTIVSKRGPPLWSSFKEGAFKSAQKERFEETAGVLPGYHRITGGETIKCSLLGAKANLSNESVCASSADCVVTYVRSLHKLKVY